MASSRTAIGTATLTASFALAMLSAAAFAGDLSVYRDFRFGADVPTVAKLARMNQAQVQTLHRRPALIQSLEWRPQSISWSAASEAAQSVVFDFSGGRLYRIAVDYDRRETEGLTADDMVEAISTAYEIPSDYPVPAKTVQTSMGDQEQILARWEDARYRFDLVLSSYGPGYRLVGIEKRAEAAAQSSSLEAARMDDLEAPRKEAARIAAEEVAATATQGRARIVNKPKFRP